MKVPVEHTSKLFSLFCHSMKEKPEFANPDNDLQDLSKRDFTQTVLAQKLWFEILSSAFDYNEMALKPRVFVWL